MHGKQRKAFTILEVLISIGLLGIVIVALFSTVSMMRDSNTHLLTYLEKSKKITEATKVLYLDIISSDGNISIKKDEYARLCMEETKNSLYGLSLAKVCWVVLKENNTLARVEGNVYSLPTRFEDRVEVNPMIEGLEIFDVYHEKDKVLVLIQQKKQEPITFMVQGITKPIVKKKKVKKVNKPIKTNRTNPRNQRNPATPVNQENPNTPQQRPPAQTRPPAIPQGE